MLTPRFATCVCHLDLATGPRIPSWSFLQRLFTPFRCIRLSLAKELCAHSDVVCKTEELTRTVNSCLSLPTATSHWHLGIGLHVASRKLQGIAEHPAGLIPRFPPRFVSSLVSSPGLIRVRSIFLLLLVHIQPFGNLHSSCEPSF